MADALGVDVSAERTSGKMSNRRSRRLAYPYRSRVKPIATLCSTCTLAMFQICRQRLFSIASLTIDACSAFDGTYWSRDEAYGLIIIS